MKSTVIAAALLAAAWGASAQTAPPVAAPGRGELLYENHCGACHGQQMHWRDKRIAVNWEALRALVVRWQGEARLNWTAEEIDDVARYLNARFYRHPEPGRS